MAPQAERPMRKDAQGSLAVLRLCVLIFLGVASTMTSFAAGLRGNVREVVALRIAKPPTLDGRLDDATWRGTALHGSVLSGFLRADCAQLAKLQPVAFLAYDDENLYLAVLTHMPDTTQLKADGSSEEFCWHDDLVQLFLEPKLNGQFYYKAFNSKGIRDDPDIKVATRIDASRWTLEAAIPWRLFRFVPEEGTAIGFNLVAYQTPDAGEWLSWAALYGGALNPKRLGYLILGEEKPIPVIPETPEEDDF